MVGDRRGDSIAIGVDSTHRQSTNMIGAKAIDGLFDGIDLLYSFVVDDGVVSIGLNGCGVGVGVGSAVAVTFFLSIFLSKKLTANFPPFRKGTKDDTSSRSWLTPS